MWSASASSSPPTPLVVVAYGPPHFASFALPPLPRQCIHRWKPHEEGLGSFYHPFGLVSQAPPKEMCWMKMAMNRFDDCHALPEATEFARFAAEAHGFVAERLES